jgi:hypothetical protein
VAGTHHDSKQAQLLDEIESFSRQGPPLTQHDAPKPVITRDKLSFPDLDQPPLPRNSASRPVPVPGGVVEPPQYGPEVSSGGLLDRLKQQAQTVQSVSKKRDADARRCVTELSDILGAAFHYLNDLVKQLNIIRPALPNEYRLTGALAFSGMSWVEGAVDYRFLQAATEDRLIETVSLRYRIAGARPLQVEREVLGIEPLRKLLHDANLAFRLEEHKNQRNHVESGLFNIPCEIKAGFLVRADYAAGDLFLRTRNVDRFGSMEFRLQAKELTQDALDDLAQLMLGQESRFLRRFRRSA